MPTSITVRPRPRRNVTSAFRNGMPVWSLPIVTTFTSALGASAGLHATAQALLQERAQRQHWEVMQHLMSAVEFGPTGLAVSPGWALGAAMVLSDGSPCTLDVQRVAPSVTDPPRGEHFTISARWADPWGAQQVLTLRSFWHASPRLLPLAAASVP